MKIIKHFNKTELVFDNIRNKSNKVTVTIGDDTLKIDFDNIINTQFSGGNIQSKFNEYKRFMNLGQYSKAECGGFVNFFKITSDKGKVYILYSGINEVSNSHYIVTVHKIIGD
jgi:hypothetical protein